MSDGERKNSKIEKVKFKIRCPHSKMGYYGENEGCSPDCERCQATGEVWVVPYHDVVDELSAAQQEIKNLKMCESEQVKKLQDTIAELHTENTALKASASFKMVESQNILIKKQCEELVKERIEIDTLELEKSALKASASFKLVEELKKENSILREQRNDAEDECKAAAKTNLSYQCEVNVLKGKLAKRDAAIEKIKNAVNRYGTIATVHNGWYELTHTLLKILDEVQGK